MAISVPMSGAMVQNILQSVNLNFDLSAIEETHRFLLEHIGSNCKARLDYETLSAAAIVCEFRQVPSMGAQCVSRTGIRIENVMRHLQNRDKEEFLNTLTHQTQKWKNAPSWLKSKIDIVRMSYRIYKKYRVTFQSLLLFCQIETELGNNLLAIFWIVYLFIKNSKEIEFDDIIEISEMLFALLANVFTYFIASVPMDIIAATVAAEFPSTPLPCVNKLNFYQKIFQDKLQGTHERRYEGTSMNIKLLAQDIIYSNRFLDDLSNEYDMFKEQLSEKHIDEISFLELVKDLTPMVRRKAEIAVEPITKMIDFENDDSDIEEEAHFEDQQVVSRVAPTISSPSLYSQSSLPFFNEVRQLSEVATPLSTRQQNLSWVNRLIDQTKDKQMQQVKQIYESNVKFPYDTYRKWAYDKFQMAVIEFTPACRDRPKRQHSIYQFFCQLILSIHESHQESQNALIFREPKSFNSIMCLATDLLNYAYQSLNTSYRRYCELFEITLLEGQKTINWFGLHLDMPKNIRDYLYSLERKIVIEEIWDDQTGFKLLARRSLIMPEDQASLGIGEYQRQALLKRLRMHVQERTSELCSLLQVGEDEVKKVIELVRQIMESRAHLLRNNKIDQMIVCSIAGCLSINYSSRKLTLEQIFNYYNLLNFSFHSNRTGLFDREGNSLDLMAFYNTVFLPEVEDLIDQAGDAADFLTTPVRLQRKKSREEGCNITPIPLKFRQSAMNDLFNIGPVKKVKPNEGYRTDLVLKLKDMDIDEKNEYDDEDSHANDP